MKTLDRYILRQFLMNLVILFVVMALLIVLLDLITNLDEFVKAGQQDDREGWAAAWKTITVAAGYYGPQICLYYLYMAGVLPIAAAGFTLASMMRNRELVAIVAGGISLHRAAFPIFLGGILCCGLQFVDQEFVIPPLRDRLTIGPSEVRYGYAQPFSLLFMPDGRGNLFSGSQYNANTQSIDDVTILKRDEVGRATERISADEAAWDQTNHGWRLTHGLTLRRSTGAGPDSQRLAPHPVEFIPSDLDPTTILLRERAMYRHLLSTAQLRSLADKPNIVDTRDLERLIHGRFSLLVMNLLILGLGLPFYLKRAPANLLQQTIFAAPLCLGAWAGGLVMLRIGPETLPPAAIAWMPVLIYLPLAFFLLDRVET